MGNQRRNEVPQVRAPDGEMGDLIQPGRAGVEGNGETRRLKQGDVPGTVADGQNFFLSGFEPSSRFLDPFRLLVIVDMNPDRPVEDSIRHPQFIGHGVVKTVLLPYPIGKKGQAGRDDPEFNPPGFEVTHQSLDSLVQGDLPQNPLNGWDFHPLPYRGVHLAKTIVIDLPTKEGLLVSFRVPLPHPQATMDVFPGAPLPGQGTVQVEEGQFETPGSWG